MFSKTIFFILGTRPEAIKLAPLIARFKEEKDYKILVCNTGQHKDMVMPVLSLFDIQPDYNLNVMTSGQSLGSLTAKIGLGLEEIYQKESIDLTIVQGDTTSVLVGALYSYYYKVPVAHIEAGLRSGDLFSPFPEEGNRKLVGAITNFHFTPTDISYKNLLNEGVDRSIIFNVGNTVIDALIYCQNLSNKKLNLTHKFTSHFLPDKRNILITTHRRENHGTPLIEIIKAIQELSLEYQNYNFVYPVHPNPNVQKAVYKHLNGVINVRLIDPIGYNEMIFAYQNCSLILTDSGGIQEEAPTFNIPVLVLRETTERMEGVNAGASFLVGSDRKKIISETKKLINTSQEKQIKNPFGDGNSSSRILSIIREMI